MRRAILTIVLSVSFFAIAFAAAAQAPPEETIAWLATGDSYSSGEGVAGNSGACAQSDLAYGPLASRTSSTLRIDVFAFTACTGLRASDYFGIRTDVKDDSSLWAWADEQAKNQPFDIVTMTFGGNDVGFGAIIKDCLLVVPTNWRDLLNWPIDDCDATEETLRNRIDALVADQTRFQIDPQDPSKRGSLPDLYRAIADTHLKPSGQLYILGYPRLIAPSGEWGLWQGTRCNGITRGDANMLGRVAQYMTEVLANAVATADSGEGRIVFIPVDDLFRSHELCGSGEDWINGSITFERDVRSAGFHPKAIAHAAEAELLLTWIDNPETGIHARNRELQGRTVTTPGAQEVTIDEAYVADAVGCYGECVVTGLVPFTHPTWGLSVLATYIASNYEDGAETRPAGVVVFDASGTERWRWDLADRFFKLLPNGDENRNFVPPIWEDAVLHAPTDTSGNLYLVYNPGRIDGIITLRPTIDGFEVLDNYYGGVTADVNGDGQLEILDINDCELGCGSMGYGSWIATVLYWNGTDFTPQWDKTYTFPLFDYEYDGKYATLFGPIDPEMPRWSGCTPDTKEGLPDGVWYGTLDGWDSDGVLFDLECWFPPGDNTDGPKIVNDQETARRVRWAPKAQAYAWWNTDPYGPLWGPWTIDEMLVGDRRVLATRVGDASFPPPVLLYVNNGMVTELQGIRPP